MKQKARENMAIEEKRCKLWFWWRPAESFVKAITSHRGSSEITKQAES